MGGGQTTFAEIAGNVTDAAFYDMTAAPDTTYTYRVAPKIPVGSRTTAAASPQPRRPRRVIPR